jgi:hypothetical protein
MSPDVTYLADHSLLLAIPAFFPALVVVGVVVYVARRDRRQGDDEDEDAEGSGARVERSARDDHDGTP